MNHAGRPAAGNQSGIVTAKRLGKKAEPYLYLLPAMSLILLFTYYPFINTLITSLFRVNATGIRVSFIGLENYFTIFKDKAFITSIGNSFRYTFVVVPVTIVIGYALAMFANAKRKLSPVYEILFSLPMAVSMSVACLIFRLLLNPNIGVVNYLFGLSIRWFTDKHYALAGLMIIGVWLNLGMSFLFLLSAVRAVPDEILECAEIEGAGRFRKLISIYLPMTSPTVFFLLCTNLASAMMISSPMIILTSGGPSNSTSTIIFYMYRKAFYLYNYGTAYASAVVGFAIAFLLILLSFRFEKRGVHYS